MRTSFFSPNKIANLGAAVLLGGLLLAGRQGRAAGPPQAVLVELFTSEGCSSCPPADRLLADLDRNQPVPGVSIIVLSEHVDYWNSLGWRDPFSSHQWSQRQDEYARRFGLDSDYTPQMVVDGERQATGSDNRAVRAAIEAAAGTPQVAIAISRLVRNSAALDLDFSVGAAPGAVLYAVVADDADRSSVERGENAGRMLEHVAVARNLIRVAELGPAAVEKTAEIQLPAGDPRRHFRLVLFAQDGKTGHIVAVAAREL